jgi:transcription antitermination factor NusG
MLIAAAEREPRWLVLKTKPRQEACVLRSLAQREIESYCPRVLELVRAQFAPRGPVPLFPGYVLCRIVLAEGHASAHYCSGSAGLVRFGDSFAAVEDEVVEGLRLREGERGYVVPELPPQALRCGAHVRIDAGPMAGLEGVVTRYMPARERVQLLLAYAWSGRPLEVEATAVRCA